MKTLMKKGKKVFESEFCTVYRGVNINGFIRVDKVTGTNSVQSHCFINGKLEKFSK